MSSTLWLRPLFRASKLLTVGGCGCYTLLEYLGSPWMLRERSMDPTFTDGQIVFCRPWPWCGDITVGDVVICKKPSEPHKHICKRVTAVAGDMVDFESLSQLGKNEVTRRPIIVPAGHVWLRGDNADHSMDPGMPVPVGLLQGKVTLRIFPGFSGSDAWKINKDHFDRGRKIQ